MKKFLLNSKLIINDASVVMLNTSDDHGLVSQDKKRNVATSRAYRAYMQVCMESHSMSPLVNMIFSSMN